MAHPAHRTVGLRLERYPHLQQRAPRPRGRWASPTDLSVRVLYRYCARMLAVYHPCRCASPTSRWGCSGAGWAQTRSSTPCACRLSSCPTPSSSAARPPTPRASSRHHPYGYLVTPPCYLDITFRASSRHHACGSLVNTPGYLVITPRASSRWASFCPSSAPPASRSRPAPAARSAATGPGCLVTILVGRTLVWFLLPRSYSSAHFGHKRLLIHYSRTNYSYTDNPAY